MVSWDVISGADYIDITCSPKALGSGRWAALEIFVFPTLDEIEAYIMEVRAEGRLAALPAGGDRRRHRRHVRLRRPLAKQQTLRPFGSTNPVPILADMEERLLKAVNATGFGPMGTGGVTTALGVHIDHASGHGFTPVAVAFNCWINRRTRARHLQFGRSRAHE